MAVYSIPTAVLLRSMHRWAYAATQDRDPVVAYLHVNYAIEDLNILVGAVGKAAVQAQMRGNLDRLHVNLLKLQDQVGAQLIRCVHRERLGV